MLTPALLLSLLASGPASPIDTRADVLNRIHALCPALIKMDRKALLEQERRITLQGGEAQRLYPGRPYAGAGWLQLGCIRAKLAQVDPPQKANWGVILREPWANQAIDVLVSGLNLRPDHPVASELFAAVAIDATELPRKAVPELYEDIALTLARSAAAGVRTPAVLRGCTSFQLAISDTTAAQLCIKYALVAGVDSTWHLLRLAWIDARHGDTTAAASKLQLAVAAAHDDSASLGELRFAFGDVPVTAANAVALLRRVAPEGSNLRICPGSNSSPGCGDQSESKGISTIGMYAGLHRLWNPTNGQAMGLVTYALARKDVISPDAAIIQSASMTRAIDSPAGTFVDARPELPNPRVSLLFRQWDAGRSTLMSRGATIELLGGGYNNIGYATGFLFVASTEAVRTWTMAASTQYGDLERQGADGLMPLDHGPLAISDPILGAARDEVSWTVGTRKIVLAPMNAVYRSDPVFLYYQVKSDSAHASLSTTLMFYRVEQSELTAPVLQVQFKTPVIAGLNEMQRELDVSRLSSGEYRLVIVAEDAVQNQRSRQSSRVTVK